MQTGRFSKWVAVAAVLCVSYVVPVATAAGSSMKETINATLAYNPTLKAFQEYRQAAEYDLSRARSGWYPRADIRAGVGPERVDDDVTRSTDRPSYDRDTFYTRSEASLTVSQTIWDGLSTWNRVNIGEGRLESAQHRLLDNAEGLALDALLAHIEFIASVKLYVLQSSTCATTKLSLLHKNSASLQVLLLLQMLPKRKLALQEPWPPSQKAVPPLKLALLTTSV